MLQDAAQMALKPADIPMAQWFSDMADVDRRALIDFSPAPKIRARRGAGRWAWNWLLGVIILTVAAVVIGAAWSSGAVYIAVAVLMVSSIVFQFDWIMPLVRGLFK
jgi:hypothetical protein